MTKPALPLHGGCRCGGLRFTISALPMLAMACHCVGCQKMTSSAFSLSAAFPSESFKVTEGEPVIGGMRASPKHYFCPSCMSWVFTKVDGMDWFVNVRTAMLDDPAWAVPFLETCTAEKLPWATTPAVHSYERMPSPEDFGRLTGEYAATFA